MVCHPWARTCYSQPTCQIWSLYFHQLQGWKAHKIWKMWRFGVDRGHARSLEIAPFDRVHTSSYYPSIVTMSLSCTIFEIIVRYWSKIADFNLPNLPFVPQLKALTSELCKDLQQQITRVSGLSHGVVSMILHLAILTEHRFVTADRRIHDDSIYRTSTASCSKKRQSTDIIKLSYPQIVTWIMDIIKLGFSVKTVIDNIDSIY